MGRHLIWLIGLLPFLMACVNSPEWKSIVIDKSNYLDFYQLQRSTWNVETATINNNSSESIWTFSITPEYIQGTILLLHGYLDHSMINKELIEVLNNNHYRVICMDLPGHGLSGGERAGLQDFQQYRTALSSVLDYWHLKPEEIFVIGHSTGGAIILDSMIHGNHYKGAILAAPLIQFRQWDVVSKIIQGIEQGSTELPVAPLPTSRNRSFNRLKSKDPLSLKTFSTSWPKAIIRWEQSINWNQVEISTQTLVLQGEHDGVVYWERNMDRLEKILLDKSIILFPKYKHHILNERGNEKVNREILDFLASQL